MSNKNSVFGQMHHHWLSDQIWGGSGLKGTRLLHHFIQRQSCLFFPYELFFYFPSPPQTLCKQIRQKHANKQQQQLSTTAATACNFLLSTGICFVLLILRWRIVWWHQELRAIKLYDGGIEWALMPRDFVFSGKRIVVAFSKHVDYRLEQ